MSELNSITSKEVIMTDKNGNQTEIKFATDADKVDVQTDSESIKLDKLLETIQEKLNTKLDVIRVTKSINIDELFTCGIYLRGTGAAYSGTFPLDYYNEPCILIVLPVFDTDWICQIWIGYPQHFDTTTHTNLSEIYVRSNRVDDGVVWDEWGDITHPDWLTIRNIPSEVQNLASSLSTINTNITTLKDDVTNASKLTKGTLPIARLPQIPIDKLPAAALERMFKVANDTARFALMVNDVQNGDTVKVEDTNKLYLVVDDTKLNVEAGYEPYTAGSASSVPWNGVQNKPYVIENPELLQKKWVATTTGTGSAYTVTLDPAPTELYVGMTITIIPHTTSTSSTPTLNVNGLGAKNIKRIQMGQNNWTSNHVKSSSLIRGLPLLLIYNGTYWINVMEPKINYSDLNGKPSAFPPESHEHHQYQKEWIAQVENIVYTRDSNNHINGFNFNITLNNFPSVPYIGQEITIYGIQCDTTNNANMNFTINNGSIINTLDTRPCNNSIDTAGANGPKTSNISINAMYPIKAICYEVDDATNEVHWDLINYLIPDIDPDYCFGSENYVQETILTTQQNSSTNTTTINGRTVTNHHWVAFANKLKSIHDGLVITIKPHESVSGYDRKIDLKVYYGTGTNNVQGEIITQLIGNTIDDVTSYRGYNFCLAITQDAPIRLMYYNSKWIMIDHFHPSAVNIDIIHSISRPNLICTEDNMVVSGNACIYSATWTYNIHDCYGEIYSPQIGDLITFIPSTTSTQKKITLNICNTGTKYIKLLRTSSANGTNVYDMQLTNQIRANVPILLMFDGTNYIDISHQYINKENVEGFVDHLNNNLNPHKVTAAQVKIYDGRCAQTYGNSDKGVDCPGFVFEDGAKIYVSFDHGSTSTNMWLNVNGTGGKPVFFPSSDGESGQQIARTSNCPTLNGGIPYLFKACIDDQLGSYYVYCGNTPDLSILKVNDNLVNPKNANIYAPNTAGTAGYELVSNGSGAPVWRPPLYGVCSTASATAAKVVTINGFKLIEGVEITVKFTYNNTATNVCTLNVNNTGAKNISIRNDLINNNYYNSRNSWKSNSLVKFRYVNNKWDIVDYESIYNIDTQTDIYNALSWATSFNNSIDKVCLHLNSNFSSEINITSLTSNADGLTTIVIDGSDVQRRFMVSGMAMSYVENIIFKNANLYLKNIDDVHNITFSNCDIHNMEYGEEMIRSAFNVGLENCNINVDYGGADNITDCSSGFKCTSINIDNCRITMCADNISSSTDVNLIYSCTDAVLNNNYIKVFCSPGRGNIVNSGNIIMNGNIIYLEDSMATISHNKAADISNISSSFVGNTVYYKSTYLSFAVISGNTFIHTGSGSIYLLAPSNITGNNFRGSYSTNINCQNQKVLHGYNMHDNGLTFTLLGSGSTSGTILQY